MVKTLLILATRHWVPSFIETSFYQRTEKESLNVLKIVCIRVKDERKTCFVAAFEAINERTNHWRNSKEKVNHSIKNTTNYHNCSHFPMPNCRQIHLPSENGAQALSQSNFIITIINIYNGLFYVNLAVSLYLSL
uniref:Uncharacterized protein n=1 Tax=Strongyloides venezuelensis TaxID=75913 RepID=A0A0K0FDQ6_STRVS